MTSQHIDMCNVVNKLLQEIWTVLPPKTNKLWPLVSDAWGKVLCPNIMSDPRVHAEKNASDNWTWCQNAVSLEQTVQGSDGNSYFLKKIRVQFKKE